MYTNKIRSIDIDVAFFKIIDDREKISSTRLFLYNFRQGKTATEFHHIFVNVFGEDVITKHKWQNWLRRFQNWEES